MADDLPPEAGEVWALNLERAAWGRGIATALMEAGVGELVRQGHRHALLRVREGNARGLFELRYRRPLPVRPE